MTWNSSDALTVTRFLIAIAVLLQTIEMLLLRRKTESIWKWSTLRREHTRVGRTMWSVFLSRGNYGVMLCSRGLASGCLLLSPTGHSIALALLLWTQLAIAVRFRGTFNGGSDTMTFQVLLTLLVAELFTDKPVVSEACLVYLALQVTLSYFVAGLVKLRQPSWRSGQALRGFLRINRLPEALARTTWALIIFECLFPLALVSEELCLVLVPGALVFHAINVYALGLNRFFFAWLAAYPALIWCSRSF